MLLVHPDFVSSLWPFLSLNLLGDFRCKSLGFAVSCNSAFPCKAGFRCQLRRPSSLCPESLMFLSAPAVSTGRAPGLVSGVSSVWERGMLLGVRLGVRLVSIAASCDSFARLSTVPCFFPHFVSHPHQKAERTSCPPLALYRALRISCPAPREFVEMGGCL